MLLAVLLGAAGCRPAPAPVPADRPTLGLMSSLPLYWGEGAGAFGAVLAQTNQPDWVRPVLERRFTLEPLDALDTERLAGLAFLVLAQPRALTPAENVALDTWVRGGGHLLLFADPMLTRHSDYAVGDPRRPQDVALLSPILARWGLTLNFDESQAGGARQIDLAGAPLVVDLAGTLSLAAGSGCTAFAEGVVAACNIGKGRILVVADAAVLDTSERRAGLEALLARAFRRAGSSPH